MGWGRGACAPCYRFCPWEAWEEGGWGLDLRLHRHSPRQSSEGQGLAATTQGLTHVR